MKKTKNIAVIGSGLAGISAASYLAKIGYKITVYEKNETYRGRLQQFASDGFKFDSFEIPSSPSLRFSRQRLDPMTPFSILSETSFSMLTDTLSVIGKT